jgi:hypothetical protein
MFLLMFDIDSVIPVYDVLVDVVKAHMVAQILDAALGGFQETVFSVKRNADAIP